MRRLAPALAGASILLLASGVALADNLYGNGTYGACQYGSCSLTLISNGNVSLNITPTASGACTIASDTVSVMTDNSAGFTLTLGDSLANSNLNNGTNSLAPGAGNLASPQVLAMNQWGYRVDGIGGFGAGPTTALNSGSPSPLAFAAVPTSSAAADTIANTSAAADPAVTTTVWYGACSNLSTPSGSYTSQVIYTATTN